MTGRNRRLATLLTVAGAGALLLCLPLSWALATRRSSAMVPQLVSANSLPSADNSGPRIRAVWGIETSYEEAVAIDSPLRVVRSRFWNHRSGEPALSESSLPTSLDYPETHKHAAAFDGLRGAGVVVLGSVRNASSYLSEDKTLIYTEMPVTVQNVLRNKPGLPLSTGAVISVARAGGVVRLPSGKLLIRGCVEESMPFPGRRYLFALDYSKTGDMFSIRTGFEIRGEHVYMLDLVQRTGIPRASLHAGFRDIFMLAEYVLPARDFLEVVQKSLTSGSD